MSPRAYDRTHRLAAAEETRARIIAAARDLLSSESGFAGLSIDAIAREAGVARMTVYYQFGSKSALLEALFDDLAQRVGMDRFATAFGHPAPGEAMSLLIGAFVGMWSSQRLVLRRLFAAAVLDPEVDQALRLRNERRRYGLRMALGRLASTGGAAVEPPEELVDVLFVLTAFDTYDSLATGTRTPEDVARIIERLVRAALDAYDFAR